MEFLSIHLNTMVDSSTFVQSVENPQHNVDVCINSALAKYLTKIDTIHCSARVYFILQTVKLDTKGRWWTLI